MLQQDKILSFFETIGEFLFFSRDVFFSVFKKPFEKSAIIKQMYEMGMKSFPVVSLTSVFTGMVFALQTYLGMKKFGAEVYTSSVLGISLMRELVPVLVGLMLAGRVGAGISAELGTMKVTEQIDALFTLGADPIKYLASPRLVAGALMTPVLVVYGDVISIAGAFLLNIFVMHISTTVFFDMMKLHLEVWDLVVGIIKSVSFGTIIALVGSFMGMRTKGGAEGVGKSTTIAVVVSSIMILLADFVWGKILPFSLRE